jgi:hypothetical protein
VTRADHLAKAEQLLERAEAQISSPSDLAHLATAHAVLAASMPSQDEGSAS